MRIEEEVFAKIELSFDQLLKYGFIKKDNTYVFSKEIHEGFLAHLEVDLNQKVTGKIYDLNLQEEYTAFRIQQLKGEFVNTIRLKYKSLLEDIKINCGKRQYFISSQGNRITDIILKEFQNKPEFLWEGYPDTGIFRHTFSGKWYALITYVAKSKLDKNAEGYVEILNVKINPLNLEEYLKYSGIYPAYHMNKKSWISICLDDSLQDEEILEFLKNSRNYVG